MKNINLVVSFITLLTTIGPAFAKGGGSSAGLTLLRTTGARISSLAGSGSAIRNDITALGFNPASVGSLSSGQASLFHEQGVSDDNFSQLMVGSRFGKGALGLSAGRYDAGKVQLFDGVNAVRDVTAQQDVVVNLAYGFSVGNMEFGGGVRYLSSQIAESVKGTATGLDLGANIPLASNLRAGLSIPVYQSKISYGSSDEDIPRIARAGLSYDTKLNLRVPMPLLLLAEVPYYVNEREMQTALGVETKISLLSFRVGYLFKSDADEFSIGTGFLFRNVGLDYSFGLVQDDLDSVHKLSVSMKFGENAAKMPELTKKNDNQAGTTDRTSVKWAQNSDSLPQ